MIIKKQQIEQASIAQPVSATHEENTPATGTKEAFDSGVPTKTTTSQTTSPQVHHTERRLTGNTTVNANQGVNYGQQKTLVACTINKLKTVNSYPNTVKQPSSDELISTIKQKYHSCNELPNMPGGPILTLSEGCYINLALVKNNETLKRERKLKVKRATQNQLHAAIHTVRDNRLSSFEDIHRPKKPLPLNQLFAAQSNERSTHKPIQRVLMLGRAGIGKSTLCQYLAYQWANKTKTKDETWLEKYDVLLWIKLRELLTQYQSYEKQHKHFGLVDAVTNCCVSNLYSGNNTIVTDAINKLIHNPTQKILWVLDGFDEVAHLYSNTEHPLYTVLHELFPEPPLQLPRTTLF